MRILIVSTSVGGGHVRAGSALEEAARGLHPEIEVRHVDVLEYVSPLYRRLYAGTYLPLTNRTPLLWGYLYKKSDVAKAARHQAKIIQAFDAIEFRHFRAMVREYSPDVLIATHFLPLQVFEPAHSRGDLGWPLVAALTDYDAHVLWAQFAGDRFFVATNEVAEVLSAKGIERGRIAVVGIPIAPAFGRALDRAAIRARLGLCDELPTVLIMGGVYGQGGVADSVRMALSLGPVQILAVAGKNEDARRALEAVKAPEGSLLRAFGYVNNVHELMDACDFVITKSGGLTVGECLAMGKPMLLPNPVPGQEERNSKYAIECGAAITSDGPGSFRYKLGLLLGDAVRRSRMAAAAKAHGRPNASFEIIEASVAIAHRAPTTI